MRTVLRRGLTPSAAKTARRAVGASSVPVASSSFGAASLSPLAVFRNIGGAASPSLGLYRSQIRVCSTNNDINPDEISFVDDDGGSGSRSFDANNSSNNTAGAARDTPYEDVTVVDTFSRARVINFVKRYSSKANGGALVAADEAKLFEVTAEQRSDHTTGIEDTVYRCRVRLPLPEEEYGLVYSEGLASSAKDAELLAAMHAEYIIDAYGFQIYTLGSMQRKHAEAARRAGRWAPLPEEGLRDVSTVVLPKRLRRVVDPDESEGAKFDLVDGRPLSFAPQRHTLLSPAILDPTALVRIKNYFALHNASFDIAVKFKEYPPIDKSDPLLFEASITLLPLSTQLNTAQSFAALGKGPDRNLALILASMHAEMIVDAFGGRLFPTDASTQEAHSKTVRSYGRLCVLPGEKVPAISSVAMPKPLKLFTPSPSGRPRWCPRGAEEDFIHKNLIVAESVNAFTNVEPKEMDGMAPQVLEAFLEAAPHYPRYKNPYLMEKIGNQWRATVVLPVQPSYGIRGGVGIAETEFEAQKLAAMHAVDTLVALGIPVSTDPAAQAAFLERRKADGRSLPPTDEGAQIDKSKPSPPGYRRVVSATLPRPQQANEGAGATPSCDGSATVEDATDPLPHRAAVPKSYWSFDSDTSDGFILVKQHGDPSEPPVKLFGHTLSCIRRIDPMAKNRIVNYLAFLGKRPTNTFTFQKLPPGRDGYPIHRCIIRLPVPAEVGDRLAIGEGPELREAEILACMHAELILDTIGVPLYPEAGQQLKHATAATTVGRYAPYPGDPLQEKSTPSPPPLRMVKDAAAKPPPKTTRVNPFSEAGKAAAAQQAEKDAIAQQAAKEAAAAAARRTGNTEPIMIMESEIDHNSKQRVNNYFRRNVKVLPEPVNTVETRNNVGTHQAKLWVPLPTRFGERYAMGFAEKKKEADALCYMHAERIIDALGLHLFNLPGLQKRHAERVKKEGRWAPMPNENITKDANTPSPPPLRSGITVQQVSKASVPTPSEDALQDFTAWGVYIQEVEEFIEVATRKYENDCYERDHVPLTGDPFIDGALADVQELPTDNHAKSILTNYLTMTNQPYPSLWRSRAVGNVNSRKCLTMVEVPGHRHLTALGCSVSKEVSQRRAAMHMLAIFQRLDPTFHATMAKDNLSNLPRGRDGEATDFRGKSLSSRQLAMRENAVGSWDATANAFTNDGKVRIIELFTVCNNLAPPYVHQKQLNKGGYTTSTTYVEVTDEDGIKHVGMAEDSGPRRNETGAYNDLFLNMSRMVPSFQSLMQLVRTHPHLSPEQIVDLQIPPEISERMEKLVENMDEDTILDSAAPTVTIDVTTEDLVQQNDVTSDPKRAAERSEDLKRKLEAKLVNKDYQEKFQARRESLSIFDKYDEIMDVISKNQVTVICGTTGCGKTTQIPQFILDWETERGTAGDCNIIVTQPRRISATSISQRIADERLETIGDTVGYTIRLDSVPGKHINFLTSGVLLRIFQAKPNLEGIRYIIIDEIHERDINSDFLLILMRELLPKRPDLRLILMSATLQSELFSGFFGKAPVINVEGYVYPVQELFLEDIARHANEKNEGSLIPLFKEINEAQMFLKAPEGESEASFRARGGAGTASTARPRYGFMECHSEIDYSAVDYAIKHIIAFNEMQHSSILVFLPGWDEIVRCRDVLEKNPKYHLLLMHSSVNNEDQLQCFKPAPEGKIKIILSTNIAESGVTIDDIRGVVDVGRAKEKSFVIRRGRTSVGKNDMGTLSQLVTVYASRANCIQRRGRAGRTRPGMCVRLYSKTHFETVADFQTPEMLRQPLDSLCLQILALNLGDPSVFLNKALEPPSAEAVEASMRRLEALGATTPTRQLTHLGLALSKLPVAPRTGKVILLGCVFKCLDTALTVASTVENEVFNASRDARESTKLNREHMTFGSLSDHLASVNGFNSWSMKIAENTPLNEIMNFINENSLFIPALRNVSRYKKQFMDILAQSGFVENRPPKYQIFVDESQHSQFSNDLGLVKSVIAAGLFPNVAIYKDKRMMRGKHDNTINTSNASIIFRTPVEDIKNPFFVFEELMRTSEANHRISARGITNVSIWAILLLGATNAQLAYRDDLNLGLIDDWIVFRASFTDLDIIKRFKSFLSKCIYKKLTDPKDFDNNATLDVLRDIIRDLVNAPIKPNNLVEERWEEMGSISPAKASMIDPTVVLTVPEQPPAEEGGADSAAASAAAGEESGATATSETAEKATTPSTTTTTVAEAIDINPTTATDAPQENSAAPAATAEATAPNTTTSFSSEAASSVEEDNSAPSSSPIPAAVPTSETKIDAPKPMPSATVSHQNVGLNTVKETPKEPEQPKEAEKPAEAPTAFVPRMTGRRPQKK